jgi:hypothetical protein
MPHDMINLVNYPALKSLCWSQQSDFVSRRHAFSIYERNWRFVEVDKLTADEHQLIEELKIEYGNGVLNA